MNDKITYQKQPGKWVERKIGSSLVLYVSFDEQKQLFRDSNALTNENVILEMENGELKRVAGVKPAKPEAVRIYFPFRNMPKEWYNPHEQAKK